MLFRSQFILHSRTKRSRNSGGNLTILAFLLASLLFGGHIADAQQGPVRLTDQQVAAKVEALLKKMTLNEKIGQLVQLPGQPFMPGAGKPEDHIRKGESGSVLWLSETAKINQLQHVAVEESRLRIPILFGLDVIHGFQTIFPVPLAMAASWDPALVEKAQAVAAGEAAAAGIRWTFTPMVDIARDARWGRIVEGAGEDPFLGAAMARAQVRGFQGPYVGSPEHILACAKHFAAYGAAAATPTPPISPRNCLSRSLPRRPGGGRRDVHERLHGF